MPSAEIADNPEQSRYEITLDGEHAGLLTYRRGDGVIDFRHTEVDDRFEGRGVGSQLVRYVLDEAREQGLRVVPTCPFVHSWIERHPDYAGLVAGR